MFIKNVGKFAAAMALAEQTKQKKESFSKKDKQKYKTNKSQYEYLAVTQGLI